MIDEVLHVLSIISSLNNTAQSSQTGTFLMCDRPLRTYEVLQELRDISSMAIDHFEEKIAPSLKKAYCELPTRSLLNCSNVQYQSKYAPHVQACQTLQKKKKNPFILMQTAY